jgi:hypothetical protein
MLRLAGILIACSALLFQSSPGMALQQTPEALRCKAMAKNHARYCKLTDPKEKHPEKVYNCLTKGAGDFRRCCDRTPNPEDCKSQTSQ